jgi:hypothetical protein
VTPAPAKALAPIRAALQKNPDVNLPDEAAGVITAGLTDLQRFRMLTESHAGPNGEQTSLLNRKRGQRRRRIRHPATRPIHRHGIVPDRAGARWVHLTCSRPGFWRSWSAPSSSIAAKDSSVEIIGWAKPSIGRNR